jgi:uncharacterized iron-regulated membrane protein
MRRAHAVTGTLWLLVFVATGAYMRYFHAPAVEELSDLTRALYRSRHIYLLGGAVANLALSSREPLLRVDRVISGLVLLAPFFLFAGFVLEPEGGLNSGHWAAFGEYCLFGAAALMVLRAWRGVKS